MKSWIFAVSVLTIGAVGLMGCGEPYAPYEPEEQEAVQAEPVLIPEAEPEVPPMEGLEMPAPIIEDPIPPLEAVIDEPEALPEDEAEPERPDAGAAWEILTEDIEAITDDIQEAQAGADVDKEDVEEVVEESVETLEDTVEEVMDELEAPAVY